MTRDTKTIFVDLDGTLFNCTHRVDFAKAGQWDDFHSRLMFDTVYPDVAELLARMGTQHTIVASTGRPERWRQPTIEMITRHGLLIDEILMRPDMNYQKDADLKIANMLDYFAGDKAECLRSVAFALEDRDNVVEAYRNFGISCWQVRIGEY